MIDENTHEAEWKKLAGEVTRADGKDSKVLSDALEKLAAVANSPAELSAICNIVARNKLQGDDLDKVKEALKSFKNGAITTEIKEAKKRESARQKSSAVQSGTVLDGMRQSQLAQALSVKFKPIYRYDAPAVLWYRRSGNIWEKCHDSVINGEVTGALLKGLALGCEASTISGVVAILKSILAAGEWVTDRHLLPLSSGVLNLKTGLLEEYGDRDFFWQLPYEFDKTATCPTVDKFLAQVTNGSEDMQRLLLAWLWAVLHGRYDLQKFLEGIGAGGSGKSTYMALATLLVGAANVHSTSLDALHRDGGKFETANLMNKRLTIIADSEDYTGGTSVLKSVTGGDVLRNEKKHVQAGDGFIYKGLVMIAANSPIMSRDYSSGMTRRKISVEFDQRASESDKAMYRQYSNGIVGAMAEEMPGLLNKLLMLDEAVAIRTLTEPDGEILRQKVDGELRTNHVLRWLEEKCVICKPLEAEDFVGTASQDAELCLYPNYIRWCAGQGIHTLSLVKFSETISDQLKSRGYQDADNLKDQRPRDKKGAKGSIIRTLRLRHEYCDSAIVGVITRRVQGL